MKTEKLSDSIFRNEIKSNSYYQRICNILFFRIKYRCFEALLTNSNLNGISTESKLKADGKFDCFSFFLNNFFSDH